MTIRTRFAPSPTGFLHIGSLRTALYAYAMARHEGGDFILRIEDTDQKREVAGALESLQTVLKKFGITWDEFYIQSERQKTGIYQAAAQKLLTDGHAFYCQCPPKNAHTDGYSTVMRDPCRDLGFTSGAIKLRVPDNQKITYHDFAHKKDITWDSNTVYDATLLKTDTFPTYALAAMVDDLDMNITHILRGHDWLPSTPIHVLVLNYLRGDKPMPAIGHLTDIMSPTTGKKLSKRRDSVFCEDYLKAGYLPEALLNFVALLGWAPKDNRELYTLPEFVEHFDVKGFQDANPRFFIDKLNYFNGQYIRQIPDAELLPLIRPYAPTDASDELLLSIIPLIKTRISLLSEFTTLTEFFFSKPAKPELTSDEVSYIELAKEILTVCEWTKEGIESALVQAVKEKGWKNGPFFAAMRLAVTGKKVSPPLTESMLILGRDAVLERLN
ncbi:glutamate--tRNA ligase [Candidatus Woesebacteria bacterium]|nr:glutamate--tRNA ligase [Candidatus Woesebacteria bacterium]